MVPAVTPDAILALCDGAPGDYTPCLATDADGTLWRGDVGDALFHHVLASGELTPKGRERLLEGALRWLGALPADRSDTGLGGALMARWLAGAIPVGDFCGLQAALCGGRSEASLRVLVNTVASAHVGQHRAEVVELLRQARARGLAVRVVTASLRVVVEAALDAAGVPYDSVSGVELAREGDRVLPALDGEVPVFHGKVQRLRALGAWPPVLGLGDGEWDQGFLQGAWVALLVHPKPALTRALGAHPRVVRWG
jgi:phosphoserine phosphatase